MRQALRGVEGLQLVLVNGRGCQDDYSGVLGLCYGVLDDGLQVVFVVG